MLSEKEDSKKNNAESGTTSREVGSSSSTYSSVDSSLLSPIQGSDDTKSTQSARAAKGQKKDKKRGRKDAYQVDDINEYSEGSDTDDTASNKTHMKRMEKRKKKQMSSSSKEKLDKDKSLSRADNIRKKKRKGANHKMNKSHNKSGHSMKFIHEREDSNTSRREGARKSTSHHKRQSRRSLSSSSRHSTDSIKSYTTRTSSRARSDRSSSLSRSTRRMSRISSSGSIVSSESLRQLEERNYSNEESEYSPYSDNESATSKDSFKHQIEEARKRRGGYNEAHHHHKHRSKSRHHSSDGYDHHRSHSNDTAYSIDEGKSYHEHLDDKVLNQGAQNYEKNMEHAEHKKGHTGPRKDRSEQRRRRDSYDGRAESVQSFSSSTSSERSFVKKFGKGKKDNERVDDGKKQDKSSTERSKKYKTSEGYDNYNDYDSKKNDKRSKYHQVENYDYSKIKQQRNGDMEYFEDNRKYKKNEFDRERYNDGEYNDRKSYSESVQNDEMSKQNRRKDSVHPNQKGSEKSGQPVDKDNRDSTMVRQRGRRDSQKPITGHVKYESNHYDRYARDTDISQGIRYGSDKSSSGDDEALFMLPGRSNTVPEKDYQNFVNQLTTTFESSIADQKLAEKMELLKREKHKFKQEGRRGTVVHQEDKDQSPTQSSSALLAAITSSTTNTKRIKEKVEVKNPLAHNKTGVPDTPAGMLKANELGTTPKVQESFGNQGKMPGNRLARRSIIKKVKKEVVRQNPAHKSRQLDNIDITDQVSVKLNKGPDGVAKESLLEESPSKGENDMEEAKPNATEKTDSNQDELLGNFLPPAFPPALASLARPTSAEIASRLPPLPTPPAPKQHPRRPKKKSPVIKMHIETPPVPMSARQGEVSQQKEENKRDDKLELPPGILKKATEKDKEKGTESKDGESASKSLSFKKVKVEGALKSDIKSDALRDDQKASSSSTSTKTDCITVQHGPSRAIVEDQPTPKPFQLPYDGEISILSFSPAFSFSLFTLAPGYKERQQQIKQGKQPIQKSPVVKGGQKKPPLSETTAQKPARQRRSTITKMSRKVTNKITAPNPMASYVKKQLPRLPDVVESVSRITESSNRSAVSENGSGDSINKQAAESDSRHVVETIVIQSQVNFEEDIVDEDEEAREAEDQVGSLHDFNRQIQYQSFRSMESNYLLTGPVESIVINVKDYN